MSGYLTGLIFLVGPTERIQRSVLLAIGDTADDKTGYGWPSVQTIANKSLYTTRYVIDAIQQLERDGWMKVEHRAIKGRFTAYTIDVERLEVMRQMQRGREKDRKRSGANISPDAYLQDLLSIQSQMKSVHLNENLPGENSSPDNSADSDEPISPEDVDGEVKSRTAEVKPLAVSGEIHDTPYKEVKPHDSSEKGYTPSPDDRFPEGLNVVQYVNGIFERHAIVAGFGTRDLAAQAIKAISRSESNELHRAAEELDRRVSGAVARGEVINNFWFTDSKWKSNGGATNGANQDHRPAGSAARVERSVGSWDRAIAQRDRARAAR